MMNERTPEKTLSKRISDRLDSGRTVLGVLSTARSTLIEKLGELYGPWLDEPSSPPFSSLLRAFHGRLSECRDHLAETAQRHLDVLSRTDELNRRSDEANDRLAAAMSAMRMTFRGVYGCAQLAHFGFPDRAPRRPRALLEASRELRRCLADPELELPPSRVPDYDLDCPQLACNIEPSIDALGETLDAVQEHQQSVQESESVQGRALAEYNEAFVQIARTLESWLRMARLDDVADRVRPSRRRPGVVLDGRDAS